MIQRNSEMEREINILFDNLWLCVEKFKTYTEKDSDRLKYWINGCKKIHTERGILPSEEYLIPIFEITENLICNHADNRKKYSSDEEDEFAFEKQILEQYKIIMYYLYVYTYDPAVDEEEDRVISTWIKKATEAFECMKESFSYIMDYMGFMNYADLWFKATPFSV